MNSLTPKHRPAFPARAKRYNGGGEGGGDMLEGRELLLRPPDAGQVRAIMAADTGAAAGSARWRSPSGPRWRRWLGRRVLEVREAEDEPLLFTVRRCWTLLPRYEVRDADGVRLGFLVGPWVLDEWGLRRAVRRNEGGAASFESPRGERLAEVRAEGGGRRVRFGDRLDGEPLVKMTLLAAELLRP